MDAERYPLSWPAGWPRTKGRKGAAFSSGSGRVSVATAIERLEKQLRLLGTTSELLSSNVETRLDGRIRGDREPTNGDPGVAVYFKLKGKDRCLACDRYYRVADNIVAIAKHIDALRRIDRYGVGTIDQAFAGYAQLPQQAASWFTVLEFEEPPKNWDVVEARYKSLARMHHPDRGGDPETMAKINAAYQTARTEYVGATHS